MDTIGVIVPVYRVEQYVDRCVESLLKQTYTDFRLVLVDDGSPDQCGAICDAYAARDSRITVIHQRNGGVSAARNAGIDWLFANSDCEWITFVDSDDWVSDRYLEYLLRAALSHHTRISMCWPYKTTGMEPQDPAAYRVQLCAPENAYVYRQKEVYAYAWGRLYDRNCFSTIRFPEGRLFEDSFIVHKVLFECSCIAVIEDPLYYYYSNPESIVNAEWTDQKLDAYRALEEQIVYFTTRGYDQICRIQVRKYLCSVQERIHQFSTDTRFSHLLPVVKKMKRTNFLPYTKYLDVNDDADAWVLTKVYPKTMWVYWHVRGLLKKLRLVK